MKITLNNKRAVVSAGGAGIGRAIATRLFDAGAEVFACDIDETSLASLPKHIHRQVCDVSDPDAVTNMMQDIVENGLDILVNNAGIAGPTAPIEDMDVEDWRQTMAVCIDSQFYFIRHAVPVFKQQQSGVIVNLTSTAGYLGFPNRAPYAAAKWGVTGLTKSLAMELGPDNIRVNAIAPGNVRGDRMNRVVAAHAAADGISEDEVLDMYTKGVSMQCFVDPEEIADTIVFLCSEQGRHISGQIIAVDGNTETLYPR